MNFVSQRARHAARAVPGKVTPTEDSKGPECRSAGTTRSDEIYCSFSAMARGQNAVGPAPPRNLEGGPRLPLELLRMIAELAVSPCRMPVDCPNYCCHDCTRARSARYALSLTCYETYLVAQPALWHCLELRHATDTQLARSMSRLSALSTRPEPSRLLDPAHLVKRLLVLDDPVNEPLLRHRTRNSVPRLKNLNDVQLIRYSGDTSPLLRALAECREVAKVSLINGMFNERSFATALEGWTNLKSLIATGRSSFARPHFEALVASISPGLQELVVAISDEGGYSAGSFIHNHHLETLAERLSVDGDKTSLKALALPGASQITDEGIASLLGRSPELENLNLKLCYNLTDAGIKDLQTTGLKEFIVSYNADLTDAEVSRIIETNPGLLHLGLSRTNISERTIEAIAANCRSLKELELNDLPAVSKESLVKLFESLPELSSLHLSHVSSLDDDHIRTIAQHMPELSELSLCSAELSDPGSLLLLANRLRSTLVALNLDSVNCADEELVAGIEKLVDSEQPIVVSNFH